AQIVVSTRIVPGCMLFLGEEKRFYTASTQSGPEEGWLQSSRDFRRTAPLGDPGETPHLRNRRRLASLPVAACGSHNGSRSARHRHTIAARAARACRAPNAAARHSTTAPKHDRPVRSEERRVGKEVKAL